MSWNFLVNGFTPNYIQGKAFYPRTEEEEERCHRWARLTGERLLQFTSDVVELERRKRVREG